MRAFSVTDEQNRMSSAHNVRAWYCARQSRTLSESFLFGGSVCLEKESKKIFDGMNLFYRSLASFKLWRWGMWLKHRTRSSFDVMREHLKREWGFEQRDKGEELVVMDEDDNDG